MGQKTVRFSDLSGQLITHDEALARIVVHEHPELIDGPVDPNSGAHMARRYAEVIPHPDVVMLADDIGHWPQLEAPDAVLTHFLAHIDRVTAG